MILYRLHTQNKRKKWICGLVSEYFSGFSVIEQTGYWNGKPEKSLCVEIAVSGACQITTTPVHIKRICKAICGLNKQECVLVQKIECDSEFMKVSS